ncbi:OmpA family protein [Bacillota bacterium]
MGSRRKAVNVDAWLNTYADMITLILVFFILLFSMSSMDQEKYKLLVKAFTADPTTLDQLMMEESELKEGEVQPEASKGEDIELDDIENLDELYIFLKKYVRENNLEASVQVEKTENIVFVKFMSTLFFEPNRSTLKPGGKEILSMVGEALRKAESFIKFIRIDGHTAEASRDNDTVNNRDLSTERANEVLKYLETNYIKDPAKLYAAGFGLHRPIAPNDSEENRAKNRRVEILIGKNDPLQEELDKLYEKSQ